MEELEAPGSSLPPVTLGKFMEGLVPPGTDPSEDKIVLVSANVTSWRDEHHKWFSSTQATYMAVQETHLDQQGVEEAKQKAHKLGLHWFGGLGGEPSPKPKGGTAIVSRWEGHARMVHICSHDGCGFTAVEMPRFPWGCLLVSVYLKDSVGTRRQPNGEILQEICAIVKPYRNFIIMGDWNSSPQEIANCGLLQGTGGGLIHAGEATVDSGGCLDFAVVMEPKELLPNKNIFCQWCFYFTTGLQKRDQPYAGWGGHSPDICWHRPEQSQEMKEFMKE